MGLIWAILVPSWCHLGAILGHCGATLGYLGAILVPSWAFLGLRSLYFTACRSQLGFKKLVFRGCEMLVFGILLPWLCPGLCLEHPWCYLGQSWAIWQPPWSHRGPYWAHLGPILCLPWAILAEYMQNLLNLRKICSDKFCVTQNLLEQILRNAKFANANLA